MTIIAEAKDVYVKRPDGISAYTKDGAGLLAAHRGLTLLVLMPDDGGQSSLH
jgi:hypothetical protein